MQRTLAFAALALASPTAAQEIEPATPGSVITAAAPEEWRQIQAEDLLVMELAPDAAGEPRTVIIQLMPPPFSQPWVKNIRTLAEAHWWDGTSVNRVQDNYVTQWGDVTEEKALPEGVVSPTASYVSHRLCTGTSSDREINGEDCLLSGPTLIDPYIEDGTAGFDEGWPIAQDQQSDRWPIHCYGYVGVGRNVAPDTGTGAELYTIIGQPQRHMDRNLAVVGRVIEGMEHLSSLPRGSGELGFYTEEEAHLRTPILSVRLGNELADPPRFEYLDTASESFARLVEVRANRDDEFYTVPAGGVDVCGVQVPIRRVDE